MTQDVQESFLSGKRVPLCITRSRGDIALHEFVALHRATLREKLTDHGAILFRGFGADTPGAFAAFTEATGSTSIDYRFRSTPRTQVEANIFTSTEYPARREIPLHNENAYHTVWPLRLAFCCVTPATQDGETPIADMRDVTRSIGAALLDRFEQARVEYTRHFHTGVDIPWNEVFQTSDRDEVIRLCHASEIEAEWLGDDAQLLRTRQLCQGVARHPATGERVFFNQAHLFHASSLGQDHLNLMLEMFGAGRLPRHAKLGDGTEISAPDLAAIHSAFNANAIRFTWRRGDVLWIDNMRVAHGRRPFQGPRRILAALMDASNGP